MKNNNLKSIAIITARGGSKRIPGKNIRDFLGKPIISYSISAAINSKLFDEVMVSTDDKLISEISKKYGAEIPFLRSKTNSSDFASTEDVLEEVLLEYKKINKIFDIVCCIYPTSPFVTDKKLIDSYNIFIKNKADSLIPVVKNSYPIQRSLKLGKNYLKFCYPEFEEKRSQDIEETFHDAGQFYWTKVNAFLKSKKLFPKKTIPYLLNELEVQDIDNESDWKIAELKYKSGTWKQD